MSKIHLNTSYKIYFLAIKSFSAIALPDPTVEG